MKVTPFVNPVANSCCKMMGLPADEGFMEAVVGMAICFH
jgi:hypothetical protein